MSTSKSVKFGTLTLLLISLYPFPAENVQTKTEEKTSSFDGKPISAKSTLGQNTTTQSHSSSKNASLAKQNHDVVVPEFPVSTSEVSVWNLEEPTVPLEDLKSISGATALSVVEKIKAFSNAVYSEQISKDGLRKKVLRTFVNPTRKYGRYFSTEIYIKENLQWKIKKIKEEKLDHVVVKLNDAFPLHVVAEWAREKNGFFRSSLMTPNSYLISFPSESPQDHSNFLRKLANDPLVSYSHADLVLRISTTPNDTKYLEQWALKNAGGQTQISIVPDPQKVGLTPLPLKIGTVIGKENEDLDAPEAWDAITDCRPILVGVLDSGVDAQHEDLKNNIDISVSKNFFDTTTNFADQNGHGTHVAGIIAAEGNNKKGVSGVCWKARVAAIRALGPDGSGDMSAVSNGIVYAKSIGVKVLNTSLGGDDDLPALRNAVKDFTDGGGLLVVAAGNDGRDIGITAGNTFPASYTFANQITVASLRADGALSLFSNFSSSLVHIAAPGDGILSAFPKNLDLMDFNPDGYTNNFGTSMAAPFVAGSAALLWAMMPTLNAGQIKETLLSQARVRSDLTNLISPGKVLNLNSAIKSSIVDLSLSNVTNNLAQVADNKFTSQVKIKLKSAGPAKVEVFLNGAAVAQFSTPEFDLSLDSLNGSLQFKVTESNGKIYFSVPKTYDLNQSPLASVSIQNGAQIQLNNARKLDVMFFDPENSLLSSSVKLGSKVIFEGGASSLATPNLKLEGVLPGQNVLTVEAKDNHGGTLSKEVHFFAKDAPKPEESQFKECVVLEKVDFNGAAVDQIVNITLFKDKTYCTATCNSLGTQALLLGKKLKCTFDSTAIDLGV